MKAYFAKDLFDSHHAGRHVSCTRPGRAPRDADDLPKIEGMRAPHIQQWTFTERRGPRRGAIHRWMVRQLGRPWSAVNAELRAGLNNSPYVSNTVYSEALRLVETAVRMDENGVAVLLQGSKYSDGPIPVSGLYVHPVTGVLCRAESHLRESAHSRKARPPEKAKQSRIVVSRTEQLHKIEGIWYCVTLAPVGTARPYHNVDVIGRIMVLPAWEDTRLALLKLYGVPGMYGVSKKQLSHKDLVRHGLLPAVG